MNSRTRRRVLGELAVMPLLCASIPAFAVAQAARRVGSRPSGRPNQRIENPISLTLTFADGSSIVFSEAESVDLGAYQDPKGEFTQLCRMASKVESPWTVFFRRDAASDRFEVIVELGWPGMNPKSPGPYVATVSRGSTQVAQTNVAEHYWWSRWRWQSALRPIREVPANLIAAKLAPPIGKVALGQRPRAKSAGYVPMAWEVLKLVRDMGTTGEREEIGLMTEPQGEWLATQSSVALEHMMAQAEAHGSVPVHFRDETMGPISIQRYPRASYFWDGRLAGADPWLNRLAGPIRPEKAHYPSLCYMPFLATGDPYYLEECQFAAQYHLLDYDTSYRHFEQGVLAKEQTRGWAWAIRALFQAVLVTPERVPPWMASKSYFQRILNNNLSWFIATQVENKTDLMKTVCHFAIDTSADHIAPWQQDYLSAVLGWAVLAGFKEWRRAYEWQIEQALGRALGRSGYPRSQAIQYYYKTVGATDWASLAAKSGLVATPDGNFPPKVDRNYVAFLRGALALAKRNGIPGAVDAFTYVDGHARRFGWLPFRWAFDD